MNYGLLINSIVAFTIFIISFFTSFRLLKQRVNFPISSSVNAIYWFALGLLYLFVGIRTLSAFFGYEDVDRFFQLAAHGVGGLIAPPVVFLFFYFLTEKFKITLIPGIILLGIWLVWIIIDIKSGVSNHVVTYWVSEWTPNSDFARRLSIYGLYLPAVLSALSMNFLLLKVKSNLAKFRILTTSISIIIIITVVLLDYFGSVGIIGRPFILIASLIALLSYSPPQFIKNKLVKH